MRILCVLMIYFSFAGNLKAQTEVYSSQIRTIKLFANDEVNSLPIISHGNEEFITVQFDQLSQEYRRYRYSISHHNPDGTLSQINEMDYLSGFNNNPIENYEFSRNTTVPYIHYEFRIPNENFSLRISGNYMITVIDDNTNKMVFKSGFRVLDKKSSVQAKISTNTDIDRNKSHQQVNFTVNYSGYNISNPREEIKVLVQQNRRTDNMVTNIYPSFISAGILKYEHNKELIFPAGNEYRRFEFVSTKYTTEGVESINYVGPEYDVILLPDKARNNNYKYDKDQNGRFLIRNAETDYSNTEADYCNVYFTLFCNSPIKNGKIYLSGDFTYDNFFTDSEMIYDADNNSYISTQFLKQGAYNYIYLFVPDNSTTGYTNLIEGNFYQTENEYTIFIYHRPPDSRYDKLIGYTHISIN